MVVLESCSDVEEMNSREDFWIKYYQQDCGAKLLNLQSPPLATVKWSNPESSYRKGSWARGRRFSEEHRKNQSDAARKRWQSGEIPSDQRGEKGYWAKLNREQVIQIIASKGSVPKPELAENYSVSQSTIANIWSGYSWRDVERPWSTKYGTPIADAGLGV